MNVVAYASLAFLIVSMLACSFVTYRRKARSYKAGDALPVLSYIILLDEIASVVIAFVSLTWMKSVPWYPIVTYLAVINFFFHSSLSLQRCYRKHHRQPQSIWLRESAESGMGPLLLVSKTIRIEQSTMRASSLRKTLMPFL